MREILSNRLWIGNAKDANDIPRLMDLGIQAMADLAYEELSPTLPRSMAYCRFPILDGQQSTRQLLVLAIETLAAFLENNLLTFVYCRAGMSRTPAITAAALTKLHGGSLEDNLLKIVSGHPHDISPQLWNEIREVCKIVIN
jgi:protein-tyrosine phosphatase